MAGEQPADASLYRRLLGEAFDALPPVLRRFHDLPGGGVAVGVLRVERGLGRLPDRLADLLRLPPAGDSVPVRLVTRPVGGREVWHRSFGGRVLVTRQSCRAGLLVEAAGPLRLGLQVEADEAGMRMRTCRCWLLGVPMPARWAPRVTADVAGQETCWSLVVTVAVPVGGLLVRYTGEVTPQW